VININCQLVEMPASFHAQSADFLFAFPIFYRDFFEKQQVRFACTGEF